MDPKSVQSTASVMQSFQARLADERSTLSAIKLLLAAEDEYVSMLKRLGVHKVNSFELVF